ncbi:MAG: flippase-like domain-containing protein [Chloroflexi bacterium]|nr:flippase-like domain-containing protein [Chloroflexota bacterium]
MKFGISPRFGTLIKLLVSVGLIVFLLTRLNPAGLLARLVHTQPQWMILALALYLLAIFLGVLKWYALVRVPTLGVSFGDLASITFTSLFAGNVLPTNIGGDIVRVVLLARAERGTSEAAAISVVVDRLMGLLAFFGVALLNTILALSLLTRSVELEALERSVIAVAGVVAVGGALFFSRRVARRLTVIFEFGPLTRFKPGALRLYRAVQVYRSNSGALAANVALSVAILIVATFVWFAVARALDLDISPLYFFLFNPLIAFVLLLPISFNGLGPKEAATIFFFGLVGVPSESAFAMSILFHAVIVLTSLPGGVLWWRQRARQ